MCTVLNDDVKSNYFGGCIKSSLLHRTTKFFGHATRTRPYKSDTFRVADRQSGIHLIPSPLYQSYLKFNFRILKYIRFLAMVSEKAANSTFRYGLKRG